MIKKYAEALIALFVILVIIFYCLFRVKYVSKNGVYTIARVEKYEPDADGSSTYLTIFLGDKEYSTNIGNGTRDMVGKYYFIKILKTNPTYEVLIIGDNPVLDCILKLKIPDEGWKSIPNCQ